MRISYKIQPKAENDPLSTKSCRLQVFFFFKLKRLDKYEEFLLLLSCNII